MIFKEYRSGIFHNPTMDVDLGLNNMDKRRGGIHWYMMEG